MRYRDNLPPEQLAVNASNDMLVFTAFLGVIIGIIISWLGKKGGALWMLYWGIGLVFASLFLGVSIVQDWELTLLRSWFS